MNPSVSAAVMVDPCSDPLWATLVDTTESDVFHSPAWMRVLRRTYGFTPQASIVLDRSGSPLAGMAFCEVDGVAGRRNVSLPFSDFCDPVIRDVEGWDPIVDSVSQRGLRIVVRTRMDSIIRVDPRFEEVKRFRWHGVDLSPGSEEIWTGMHESARRAVRKARNSGVEVHAASTPEELRAFYEMHLAVRKYKYRLLAQPYEFFETIWDEFHAKGDGSLLLASIDGQIIGGALFLTWKDRIYYKFNASTEGSLAVRPNDLVIWSAIEQAAASGLSRLDFGLSDWDQESLARYKRKFGAAERDLVTVRSRSGRLETDDLRLGDSLARLTTLLTDDRVPDSVTEEAAFLYRYFA